MKRLLLFLFFIGVFSSGFGYFSKFLNIQTNTLEYRFMQNPEKFPLKVGALIASGVKEEFLPDYFAQINNFEEGVRTNADFKTAAEPRSVLFKEMHKAFFKQYQESSTTLDVLLKSGRFNCLSSTAFYCSILEDFGFDYQAAVVPSHIFTILKANGKEIDVENTTPYGYDIGNNTNGQIIFKKLTGFEYNRDNTYLETVGKRGILSYTYGNIIHFAIQLGQYEAAFQSALRAIALYPEGRFAQTNAIAGYSQYAVYLCDQKKDFPLALAVTEEGFNNLPQREFFRTNYLAVLEKYMESLIQKSRFNDAFAAYQSAQPIVGKNQEVEEMFYGESMIKMMRSEKNFDKAYDFAVLALKANPDSKSLRSALDEGFYLQVQQTSFDWKGYQTNEARILRWYNQFRDPTMDQNLEYWYLNVGKKIFDNLGVDNAIAFLRNGEAVSPNKDSIQKNIFAYAVNASNVYFNKQDYPAGLKYARIAMDMDPKNPTILKNISIVYQQMVSSAIDRENYAEAWKINEEGLKILPDDQKLLYFRNYLNRKSKAKN